MSEHILGDSIFIVFMAGDYTGNRDFFWPRPFIFLARIAKGYDRECHIGKSTEALIFAAKERKRRKNGN
jgi:hypothetical protein